MYRELIERTAAAIRAECGSCGVGLILGSGLGGFADSLEESKVIPYADIPGHPTSSVPGHKGQYVVGRLAGKTVVVMQGRFHLYEGYPPQMLAIGVRVMKRLGVTHLVLTNAAGGINPEDPPGTLLLLKDHINYSGVNPLTGPNDGEFGPRFPDMGSVYDKGMRAKTLALAEKNGIVLREGVYIMFSGPCYETPAEIRMARMMGADSVGMSTVPEVIAAAHCGIKVVAFSVVTNYAAGILDQPLSHDEVQCTADMVAEKLGRLIGLVIGDVCP